MRGLLPALVALAIVLSVALGVVIALIIGGAGTMEEATDETAAPTTTRVTATTTRTPRTSTPTPTPTTVDAARSGPVCEARVINRDLGYPGSGARIIDCDAGWAVMGSEISGDPFWVAYSNGRWRRVEDVSIYVMTCPEEAIARGAPAWLARAHLDCRTVDPVTSTTSRTATSSRAPSPSRTPSASATTSTQTSSSSTTTSESETTSEETSTSPPGDDADE